MRDVTTELKGAAAARHGQCLDGFDGTGNHDQRHLRDG